ncbi:MAG: hypothetical protein Q3982_04800 [Phoenicibacter congonensis]|uniref:NADH:ubiquinone oxidoreductase-like 20kDa subunit domain-containing protein n=1 Tax=Phoenicibacter congonensis TaxID=1944646 RepID=A0AA43U658_9ACTN|nr:hypothetical protein [Phoenicibacter congonensis]
MQKTMQTKPTLGFFELASCHGCEQQVFNADLKLLDVFNQVDIAYWPKMTSRNVPTELDISVVEGAIETPEQEDFIKELRECSKTIIALGACACGLNNVPEGVEPKYKSVSDVVKVDFFVRCCPIDTDNFINVLQKAIGGRNTFVSTAALCGECKSNEKSCFFSCGKLCAGLVSVCGCDALCTRLNKQCRGCSGVSRSACMQTAFDNANKIVEGDGEQEFCQFLDVCSVDRLLNKDLEGLEGDDAVFVASRFDGENSQECSLCAIKTLEQSENISPDERTQALRECLTLASRAQNHITSLFLVDLRKIYGHAGVQEFADKENNLVVKALELRHVFTEILEEVGGRAVHPITCEVGGFSVNVPNAVLCDLKNKLEAQTDFAVSLIDRFASVWEQSTLGETDTTALTRVLENWDDLTDDARFGAAKAGLRPPETDVRKECVARAIEVVDAINRIDEHLTKIISV